MAMSLRRALPVLFILAVTMSASPAWAWRYGSRGYGGGGTVYGSAATGMGNLIRAQGAYNQMTAQAMMTVEQTKTVAIDNKLKAAQTYYQLRRLNESEHAEQLRKDMALHAPAPPVKIPRLTAAQLDPVTGNITWMPVLLGAEFQPEREQVEHLFAQRAINPANVTNSQVEHLTNLMRDKLDGEYDKLSLTDFFGARHFLESLTAETKYTGFEDHPDAAAAAKN
jgi:hypothetical protein